jgi:hypothetical protein
MRALAALALWALLSPFALLAADSRGPLNSHLPSWVTLGAQVRYRAESTSRSYLLERYRLDVELRPAAWLGLVGQWQDSRAIHYPHPDAAMKDRADIRQAYVRLGSENGWWDIKAGRQRMAFGSERVIGAGEWGNTARAFDAVRVAIHHGDDRVDIFSSAVVVNGTDTWDHHREGNNLHGLYASFGSWLAGNKVEPYLLLRSGLGHGWTYGLRIAGAAGSHWSYELESLGQRNRDWAAIAQLKRHFRDRLWQPALLGEANYASAHLDQLLPTNHGIYGIADQIGRRNTKNLRGGIWLHPEKRLTVKVEGHSFWLADPRAGVYAFNGVLTVPGVAGGARHADVGPEFDLLADFRVSSHTSLGAQHGHLYPGRFLRERGDGNGRTFCAVFVEFHL